MKIRLLPSPPLITPLVLFCLLSLFSISRAAESNAATSAAVSYSGIFKDDRVTLELAPPGGAKKNYTGTIHLGDQSFPVTASIENGMLRGTFESQGDHFSFAAAMDGPTLTFTTEGGTIFKAETGKLDEATKVFQTMIASLRPNMPWFNRYLQLVQMLAQNQLEQTGRVGELSRYIARTNDEINDLRRQAYTDL